jgi:MFS family permease
MAMSTIKITQRRLPPTVSFPILSFALFAYFFAASAPSPAFVLLQHEWHFSASLLTIAFGVYAISLLIALLMSGSLSDYVGRKPVIFVALIIQAASMAIFFLAQSIEALIAARIIQGFATGVANGALSAAVVEAAPEGKKHLGATISSVAPLAGLALGAMVSGLAIKMSADPITLVFGWLTILFVAGALIVVFTIESVTKRAGGLASMIPRVSVPKVARREFFRAVPVLITTWALGGLYLALVPSVIRDIFNTDNGIVNGLAIAILSGIGAIAPSFLKKFVLPKAAIIGIVSVLIGLIFILISLKTQSLILFFIASAIGGIGFGGAFTAIIQTLAPLVPKHERAGLFAAIFVVSYLALSVPAMLAGLLVKPIGLLLTIEIYSGSLLVTGLLGMLLQNRSLSELQ